VNHWQMLQQSILAYPHATCLLDSTGKVIAANRNWCCGGRDGAGVLALAPPGTDYFAYCHQIADLGFEPARAFAEAVQEIIAGRRGSESLDYSHCAAERSSRYSIEAAVNRGLGSSRILLVHRRLE